jgi:hypothetical protein
VTELADRNYVPIFGQRDDVHPVPEFEYCEILDDIIREKMIFILAHAHELVPEYRFGVEILPVLLHSDPFIDALINLPWQEVYYQNLLYLQGIYGARYKSSSIDFFMPHASSLAAAC